MTLRHLKIFLEVCRSGGITAAAEKLGLAQPAVSLAVRELEDSCGVRLFDRISRRLYLTEDGEELLKYARQIVSLCGEAEDHVRNRNGLRRLRVGSSITIGTCLMPGYVGKFATRYPQVKVCVTIDSSAAIEKKILADELNFALVEGMVHSESMIARRFLKDRLVLVCGAGHPFSKREQISLDELAGQTLILREKGSGTRQLFDSTLLTHGLTLEPDWESVSTQAIVGAVAAGLGVSVLPYRLVERDLAEGRLRSVKIEGVEFNRYFYLIYHKDKHLSESALAFLECTGIAQNISAQNEPVV